MPDPPTTPRLDYDRSGGAYATRRSVRLLTAFTLLNTVLLFSLVLGVEPGQLVRSRLKQWQVAREAARFERELLASQQKCLQYTAPADRVVYEEDPAAAAALLARPAGDYVRAIDDNDHRTGREPAAWQPPVKARDPDALTRYNPLAPASVNGPAVLFLHERSTPSGQQKLVGVALTSRHHFRANASDGYGVRYGARTLRNRNVDGPYQIKTRTLTAAVIMPAGKGTSAGGMERRLNLRLPDDVLPQPAVRAYPDYAYAGSTQPAPAPPIDYGNKLRLFAGQPDPADPTHFTIRYQLDGKEGVIDGWLRDNDVILKPREGAPANDGSGDWELVPKTQPAN